MRRERVLMYVVIVDDVVVFRSSSVAEAFAFQEGYGEGEVLQVLAKAQENVRRNTSFAKRQSNKKPMKSR